MADLTRKVVLELLARNRARGELASFSRSIDTTFRSVRRMAGGILALAGIGGLGYMLREQAKVIDSTAKLSDRLGITTESLVGLQHGAKIAGVDTGTLNKSLEIFSRRLGEVDMGVGQAHYALEKLGIDYRELIGKSPDEAIGIVADQINRLSTQAEKAAAANYLFGRSGQQLLNLFEKGSAGIAEYREKVRKLGISFSRIDAAKVEAANDALTRTGAVFTGISRTLVIELAPYIEAGATAFNKWATSGEGAGAKVIGIIEGMTFGIVNFNAGIHDTIARMYELADVATNLDELFKWMGSDKWKKTYAELANEQRKLAAEERAAAQQSINNIRTQMNLIKNGQQIQWPAEGMSDADLWLNRLEASNQKAVDSTDKSATQRLQIIDKMYRDMGSLSDDWYRNQINMLGMQRADYAQHVDDKLLLDRWYYSEITKINDQIRQQELEREQERLQIAGHFLDETRNRFITFWDPVIDKSKDAKQAMDDFFQSLFIRFAQAKAQMAMLNLLNLGTGGGWGGTSILGFGFAKGGIVGRDGEPRMVPAAAFAGAERFDQGGIVGLKSNEVPIIAHRGERIISKEQSASGGQPIVQNYYYIDAIDVQSFQNALAKESNFLADLHGDALRRNHRIRRMR